MISQLWRLACPWRASLVGGRVEIGAGRAMPRPSYRRLYIVIRYKQAALMAGVRRSIAFEFFELPEQAREGWSNHPQFLEVVH